MDIKCTLKHQIRKIWIFQRERINRERSDLEITFGSIVRFELGQMNTKRAVIPSCIIYLSPNWNAALNSMAISYFSTVNWNFGRQFNQKSAIFQREPISPTYRRLLARSTNHRNDYDLFIFVFIQHQSLFLISEWMINHWMVRFENR